MSFDLSVIIPTRNRANQLVHTLSSILRQNFKKDRFEVIVVDNGSTDDTKGICEIFSQKFINFRYEFAKQPGLHVGRNIGFKVAKAEILVYADDDIEAFPSWLEGIWESFQKDDKIALVGGKNLPKWESDPPSWIMEMWMKPKREGHYLGYFSILDFGDDEKFVDPLYVWGCNFSVRKSILVKTNGFHPDGMPSNMIQYRGDGESYVSSYIDKNGYKAYYSPKASIYHFVPSTRMTMEYLELWTYRIGIGQSYMDIRNGEKEIIKEFEVLIFLRRLKYLIKKNMGISEETAINRKLRNSFQNGYKFHQMEVIKNPALLEWVKREDYLDISDQPYSIMDI